MRLPTATIRSLLALPLALVLIGSFGPAVAQVRSDFKVYDVDDILAANPKPLALSDQFQSDTLVPEHSLVLDLFANSVQIDGGVSNSFDHKRWYRLTPPDPPHPTRRVTYTSRLQWPQLDVLHTGDPTYLVVPSQKEAIAAPGDCTAPPASVGNNCVRHSDCDVTPGDGVCGGFFMEHFLCYDVTWAPQQDPITVDLLDQFGFEEDVVVGDPRYFCNPTEKVVDPIENPEVYPIDPFPTHLVCYDIEPKFDHDITVTTEDQFNPEGIHVRTNELLCVNSEKEGFAVLGAGVPAMGRWAFATLFALLMLVAVAWVGYRRRRPAPGSAA